MTERDKITELLCERKTVNGIAKTIGHHKSIISRKLKRNSSPEYKLYLSHRAHHGAEQRKIKASCRLRLKNDSTRKCVVEKLMIGWSPEIIAGRINKNHPRLSISHESKLFERYSSA